eukprot:CAMPEP_0113229138 /NCGR_PEP_ID=MMETSP0008_2-20120614/194_1 /TAXON_ID=97485 /ORGANISM="Prymnesium parvum" /LENGTH=82 /DNA_ID=CAMNT_0000075641 /DNA_START=647 /DNA_END=895 /DNA_ORIENTATION=- /assembly_acc=CAM_ASM_000153
MHISHLYPAGAVIKRLISNRSLWRPMHDFQQPLRCTSSPSHLGVCPSKPACIKAEEDSVHQERAEFAVRQCPIDHLLSQDCE